MELIYSLLEINLLAKNTSVFCLQADAQFNFIAGQYVEMLHGGFATPLSIACKPNNNHKLEFHLSHSNKNIEACHLLETLNKEKKIALRGPFGNTTIHRFDETLESIFVAHGTGFAPVKAILEAMFERKYHKPIYFYWSLFRTEDLYLQQVIESWLKENSNFHYEFLINQSPSEILNHIHHVHGSLENHQAYVSGAYEFVQVAFSKLIAQQLPKKYFYSDMI